MMRTKTRSRQRRSASGRRRLAENYRSRIRRSLGKIVSADAKAIHRKLEDENLSLQAFQLWIADYFDGRVNATSQAVRGVFRALATEAAKMAAAEIQTDPPSERVQGFAAGATDQFAENWRRSGTAQLQQVAADAGEDEYRAAVSGRVDEWGERRAAKAGKRESHGIMNGIARIVFTSAGYALIWVTAGGSCPFCASLDGKRVGGAQPFVPDGKFEPTDAPRPMKVRRPVLNPPLHQGCVCSIVAG